MRWGRVGRMKTAAALSRYLVALALLYSCSEAHSSDLSHRGASRGEGAEHRITGGDGTESLPKTSTIFPDEATPSRFLVTSASKKPHATLHRTAPNTASHVYSTSNTTYIQPTSNTTHVHTTLPNTTHVVTTSNTTHVHTTLPNTAHVVTTSNTTHVHTTLPNTTHVVTTSNTTHVYTTLPNVTHIGTTPNTTHVYTTLPNTTHVGTTNTPNTTTNGYTILPNTTHIGTTSNTTHVYTTLPNTTHDHTAPADTTLPNTTPTPTSSADTTAVHSTSSITTPPATTDAFTTQHVPTTTAHSPLSGTWYVNQSGEPCLIVQAAIQVNISYPTSASTVSSVLVNFPETAESSGSCGPNTSQITLGLQRGDFNLTFTFQANVSFNGLENAFMLSQVSLEYSVDGSMFPDSLTTDTHVLVQFSNVSIMHLGASMGSSFKCDAEQSISLDSNHVLTLSNVQVQPFSIKDGKFGKAEACPEDIPPSSYNVGVAVALGVTIPIIFVLVFVGWHYFCMRKGGGKSYSALI